METKKTAAHRCDDIRSGTGAGLPTKPSEMWSILALAVSLGSGTRCERACPFAGQQKAPTFICANIDANDINTALLGLNPETTCLLWFQILRHIGTQVNAATARSWFLERTCNPQAIARHFIGVTTNLEAAARFGWKRATFFLFGTGWAGGLRSGLP